MNACLKNVLEKEYIFIIGSPKSGTTWLQIMLGAHPQAATTVELTLFSKYTHPWIEAWRAEHNNIEQGRWHQGLPFLWSEEEFIEFLRKFLAKVYERVLETNSQATHILDKHPSYSLYIDDIDKLLPKARFIHIIRDGRDVAVSMIAAHRNIGYGKGDIASAASAWQQNVKAARRAARFDGRYLEVRYEDLLTKGVETLATVYRFCQLPTPSDEITRIVQQHQFEKMKVKLQHADPEVQTHKAFYRKGAIGDWRVELTPTERYIFYEVAGELLSELGYDKNTWWADSRLENVFLPLAVALRNRNHIKRRMLSALRPLFRHQFLNIQCES